MGTLKKLELAVGVFVVLGLAAFFMLAMKVSNIAELGEDKGYKVTARFENIGGLKIRAPVTLGGVRIGRVVGIGIDKAHVETQARRVATNEKIEGIPFAQQVAQVFIGPEIESNGVVLRGA